MPEAIYHAENPFICSPIICPAVRSICGCLSIGFRDKTRMSGGRSAFSGYLVKMNWDACLELFAEYNRLDAMVY